MWMIKYLLCGTVGVTEIIKMKREIIETRGQPCIDAVNLN